MIYAIENQSVLDVAIQEFKSVLAAFDFAIENGLSITDTLDTGQMLRRQPKKEYEVFDLTQFLKNKNYRNEVVTVIENQSLLDIAIQTDGNVLASFDWALNNDYSITDPIAPGQKLKMPKSTAFRYDDLANHFKGTGQNIATGFLLENSDLPIMPDGIGAMIIETSFTVN